jgi:transposase InsO family protein
MRQAGLKPVWKRKFIHTADSKHDLPIAANGLARQFNPAAPNKAYVSGITYVRTGAGWLYLAVVIDLSSRKVGWAMALGMPAKLNCWDNAVAERFFLNLKMEPVWQREYANHVEARIDIAAYIVGLLLQQRPFAPSSGRSVALRLRTEHGSKKTYRCVQIYLTTTLF